MGNTLTLAVESLWKVLALGLVLGAGIPVLFSAVPPAPHPVGRVVGVVCFAVVLLAVALGLTFIVATGFGKALSFEHVYPTLVDK
jgi:hypothetical protein